MKRPSNKAIVVGTNHYNTLGVIRSLGEKGIPVNLILISKNEGYVSKSKYVDQTYLINKSEDEIMDTLLTNFNEEKDKPVIIPTSDFAMKVLDSNLELLKESFFLPNIENKQGQIIKLMNKMKMSKLAKESGFMIPPSWELSLTDDNIVITEGIPYPCIVKPLSSIDGKKKDIVICNNKTELTNNLYKFKESYNKVLIQEYIDGQDAKMIEIIGCVTLNKEIIIPGIIEKIREYPLRAGSTSYASVTKDSKHINLNTIHSFLEKMNYIGLFDIEFKYANGHTYFIEINFRNGAPAYALTKAGVNMPYIWYIRSVDNEIHNVQTSIKKSFNFMMEVRDFKHVLNKDISFLNWLQDLTRSKVFLFLNLRDIRPILARIFRG